MSACCEVSVGEGCEWRDGVYLEGPVRIPFFTERTRQFDRLHTTVSQGSSPKEPQLNWPLELKPTIARLTRIASSEVMSSSLSPAPARREQFTLTVLVWSGWKCSRHGSVNALICTGRNRTKPDITVSQPQHGSAS